MEIGQSLATVTGGAGEIHASKGSALVDCLPKAMPTGGFELRTDTKLGIAKFEQGQADAAVSALKGAKGIDEVAEGFASATKEQVEANIALAAAAQEGAKAAPVKAQPMKMK